MVFRVGAMRSYYPTSNVQKAQNIGKDHIMVQVGLLKLKNLSTLECLTRHLLKQRLLQVIPNLMILMLMVELELAAQTVQ